ncbi:hypothetical protein AQUSIP_19150 [Aquicella siphonis]|uniref:Uncharacterized protein n=1 Tax=Aquicella siphonis TaxID=254247 RepID=A0A5E4PJK3_9COXI|nr:tetratricopeptide repeat protein [Aquicella siphonis]VVC76593.1 hypothetical protein AQUSIP_19150 [Aquicella siphonis]
METKFAAGLILLITVLSASTISLAEITAPPAARQNAPVQAAGSRALSQVEKEFAFNWNDYSTIPAAKARIAKTEGFLNAIQDFSHLNAQDTAALGKLYYKLGTYYTHVTRESDLAIHKLQLADAFLTTKQDKAWNNNHLAYAYEQKYAASGNASDRENALRYANKVITQLYSNAKNREVAFAYCVKGLVMNDAREFPLAEMHFKTALDIYESMPGGKDDQYARAKNRLAHIILDQNGRDKLAVAMLEQLKQYWMDKKNIGSDPYAARNFISLGQAYLKTGRIKAAQNEFDRAVRIYEKVYGANNPLLAKPYQLLAETYKNQGRLKQAALYEKRAAAL